MAGFFRKRKMKEERRAPFCTAVVAAAGSSQRFGDETKNKIFAELCGIPVLAHSLIALESCPLINEIVIVTRSEDIIPAGDICKDFGISKAKKVVKGGATRTASVLLGIMEVSPKTELVAIHDGARPNITRKIIEDTVAAAAVHHAAAPAVALHDTIKAAKGNMVTKTVDRRELFAVQTPQVFDADLIKGALYNAVNNNLDITDDCMAVEIMGGHVCLTEGSHENIKITTAVDLITAEAVMSITGRE